MNHPDDMNSPIERPPDFDLPPGRLAAIRQTLADEIVPGGSPARRRLRAVPVIVATVVLLTATVAGAALLRPEYDPSTEVLPGDRIDAIARLQADITLPPGGDFNHLVDVDYTEDEAGLAGSLAFDAWCQWTGYWIDGELDDDETKKRAALEVMNEAPEWPQLVAVDGGGVTDGLADIAAAAGRGDIDAVVQHYRINCSAVSASRTDRLADLFPTSSTADDAPEHGGIPDETCQQLRTLWSQVEETPESAGAPLQELLEVALTAGAPSEPLVGLVQVAIESGTSIVDLSPIGVELNRVCT